MTEIYVAIGVLGFCCVWLAIGYSRACQRALNYKIQIIHLEAEKEREEAEHDTL